MISISPERLPENIVSMAHDLVKHDGAYPRHDSEYSYFHGSKQPDVIGRHVLTLIEGSFGDDEGSESYASSINLHYYSDETLRKITGKEMREPGVPLLMPPSLRFNRPDIAKYVMPSRRETVREYLASTATLHVARMTKLLQDDAKA